MYNEDIYCNPEVNLSLNTCSLLKSYKLKTSNLNFALSIVIRKKLQIS